MKTKCFINRYNCYGMLGYLISSVFVGWPCYHKNIKTLKFIVSKLILNTVVDRIYDTTEPIMLA